MRNRRSLSLWRKNEPLRLAGTLTSPSSSLQGIMQINLPSVLAAFVGSPINRGGVFCKSEPPPDFVVGFAFFLLARHNQSKLCFCSCFDRQFVPL